MIVAIVLLATVAIMEF